MIKISSVIITLNEEQNIARCINSLKRVSDEIIVVDSFSTDNTVEICNELGARVLQRKFTGYRDQKQWAAEQAQNDFVLSLDADEELSEKLIESILELKKNPVGDAFTMNRLNSYCGKWIKHCGWYPDRKIRLWNRKHGSWLGVNLHEKVEVAKDCKISHLEGDILHYTYNTISQHVKQLNAFTDIGAQEAFEKGKKANLFMILFKSIWKFKRDYIFKLGFLDGYYGFIICYISAFATFLKYAKLRELNKNAKIK